MADDGESESGESESILLERAVENGDIATLLHILEDEGRNLEDLVPDSRKLLIEALERGYFDIAALMVSKGAPVNCTSEAGWTPLHIAAGEPAANEVVKMMLERGADVNAEIAVNAITDFLSEEAGDTPLHCACLKGNLEVVKLLIQNGADCNKTNTHCTPPLIIAVKGQWSEITEILLENGADVHQYNINPPSLWCLTPLDWAMSQLFSLLGQDNLNKIVHHFLSWEPDDIAEAIKVIPNKVELKSTDMESLTRLMIIIGLLVTKGAKDNIIIQAMKFRYADEAYAIAKILFQHGAKMDVEDQRGISLMQVAACVGFYDMIKLFLDNGADGDRPNHCGWTPLMISLAGFREVDLNVVRLFIEYGADLNAKDDKGKTPLMIAIPGYISSPNHSLIIEFLLDHGAQVNIADSDGDTPLSRALRFRKREDNDDIIKLLLDRGAEVNTQNSEGNTPLHIAISKPDRVGIKIIKMLLDHGAEVDARDTEGNTPLMLAITYSVSEIAEVLIEHGSDINAKNNAGDCPFQLALLESRPDILSQLLINNVKFDPMILLEDRTLVRSVIGTVPFRKKEVKGINKLGHRLDIKKARRDLVNSYIDKYYSTKDRHYRGRMYLALYENVRNSPTEFKCVIGMGSYALLFSMTESRLLASKLAGGKVSGEHLKAVLSYRYDKKNEVGNPYNFICNREIKRMREYKVTEYMNLFELITKDHAHLAACSRNDDISRKLLDVYHRCNGDTDGFPFPIFGNLIKDRIQNALARKKLLRAGEYSLNSLLLRNHEPSNFPNHEIPSSHNQLDSDNTNLDPCQRLPVVVCDAILALLSDQDLQNMIAADCGITTENIAELHVGWREKLVAIIYSPNEEA